MAPNRLTRLLLALLLTSGASSLCLIYRIRADITGSRPNSGPASWFYDLSSPLVGPFESFDTNRPLNHGPIIDLPSLIALEVSLAATACFLAALLVGVRFPRLRALTLPRSARLTGLLEQLLWRCHEIAGVLSIKAIQAHGRVCSRVTVWAREQEWAQIQAASGAAWLGLLKATLSAFTLAEVGGRLAVRDGYEIGGLLRLQAEATLRATRDAGQLAWLGPIKASLGTFTLVELMTRAAGRQARLTGGWLGVLAEASLRATQAAYGRVRPVIRRWAKTIRRAVIAAGSAMSRSWASAWVRAWNLSRLLARELQERLRELAEARTSTHADGRQLSRREFLGLVRLGGQDK